MTSTPRKTRGLSAAAPPPRQPPPIPATSHVRPAPRQSRRRHQQGTWRRGLAAAVRRPPAVSMTRSLMANTRPTVRSQMTKRGKASKSFFTILWSSSINCFVCQDVLRQWYEEELWSICLLLVIFSSFSYSRVVGIDSDCVSYESLLLLDIHIFLFNCRSIYYFFFSILF